jgi:hypothetical protein
MNKGMKLRTTALLLCALLAPLPALADTPNFKYDWVELGRQSASPQYGADLSGPYANVSYTFLSGVQLHAGYGSLDLGAGLTRKDYEVGFTGEDGIGESTDVFTDLLYLNHRTDTGTGVTTDDGYRLAVGLRHRAWKLLEVDGWLAHNYLAQGSNELGLGALVDATSWLAVGFSYAHDSNQANTTLLRVRLYF